MAPVKCENITKCCQQEGVTIMGHLFLQWLASPFPSPWTNNLTFVWMRRLQGACKSHRHVGHRGRQGLVKAHLTNKEELSYEKVSWDLSLSHAWSPRSCKGLYYDKIILRDGIMRFIFLIFVQPTCYDCKKMVSWDVICFAW